MVYTQQNYLAVIASAIAAMIVGFLWYSPGLFGYLWLKIIGKDAHVPEEREQRQREVKPYFPLLFIASLAGAYVLALFMSWTGTGTALGGMHIAIWAWLGFAVPFDLGSALFSGRHKDLIWPQFLVQTGHHLVVLLVMGLIIGAWH